MLLESKEPKIKTSFKIFFVRDVTQLASMCKLKVGRLLREVNDSCLQFWGGMGFTNDVLVSRMYR